MSHKAEYKVIEGHDAMQIQSAISRENANPPGGGTMPSNQWRPILMSSATLGNSVRHTVILGRKIE